MGESGEVEGHKDDDVRHHCVSADAKETDGERGQRSQHTKSMHSHMLGATGAAEAIATIMALRSGIIPPTVNLDVPDPECDLDYTPNKAVKADVTLALSDSFGFGGHNACIAFRKI